MKIFKNYVFKNQFKVLNTKITLKFFNIFNIFNHKMINNHSNLQDPITHNNIQSI